MRQHQRRVYRVIFLLVRDADTADTLTQECFLRAYQKRASFRGECRIETWMLRIAVNLVRDHGKKPPDVVLEEAGRIGRCWPEVERREEFRAPAVSLLPGPRRNVRCWHEKNWKRSGMLCLRFRRNSGPFSSCATRRKCLWRRSRSVLQVKVGSVKTQLARATGKLREMKEKQWK